MFQNSPRRKSDLMAHLNIDLYFGGVPGRAFHSRWPAAEKALFEFLADRSRPRPGSVKIHVVVYGMKDELVPSVDSVHHLTSRCEAYRMSCTL